MEIFVLPSLVPNEDELAERKEIVQGLHSLKAETRHQRSAVVMNERKSQLAKIPFNLFQDIHVHFVPQLAYMNGAFFEGDYWESPFEGDSTT